MLGRSHLSLKQPLLGKKGRQRRRDRAALGEGLALRWFSFHRGVTYLMSLKSFFGEVLGPRAGSWGVVGLGPHELLPSSHTFLYALRP